MSLSILGLGTAVPVHTMSQDAALEMSREIICQTDRQQRLMKVLFRKSGVGNRHTVVPHPIAYEWAGNGDGGTATGTKTVVRGPTTLERMQLYAEHAAPLAEQAARKALEQSSVEPEQFTHLITVSCTGFDAPGVDVHLISKLGLPATTQRVQVGFMGCHGAINGLRVAHGIANSDPQARILLCAVEVCSLHYRFDWHTEGVTGNALFADGAAAIVCGARPPDKQGQWQVGATGSCLVPDSTSAITWEIGDYGFEMNLSSEVPELILENLNPWLSDWLGQHGQTIESVGMWAVHPGGPRILSAVEKSLGLSPDALNVSRQVLNELGNMSSPTVLFIFERLVKSDAVGPCVALGFGPGLFAEAALLQ